MKEVEVLILAGGKGTRLREIVSDVPKPMANIDGQPFLEHLITYCKKFGFTNYRILTGYKGDIIRDYFQDGEKFGVSIHYSHEDVPLGTGGAIKKAMNSSDSKSFLCLNGDSIFTLDLKLLVSSLKLLIDKRPAIAGMALKYFASPDRYGTVTFDSNYVIEDFSEKDSSVKDAFINSGVYFFSQQLSGSIKDGFTSLESDIFPELVLKKELLGVPCTGHFIDIGIPADYLRANKEISAWIESDEPLKATGIEAGNDEKFKSYMSEG